MYKTKYRQAKHKSDIETQPHQTKIFINKRGKKRYESEYKQMKEQMGWSSPLCSEHSFSDSSEYESAEHQSTDDNDET